MCHLPQDRFRGLRERESGDGGVPARVHNVLATKNPEVWRRARIVMSLVWSRRKPPLPLFCRFRRSQGAADRVLIAICVCVDISFSYTLSECAKKPN